MVNIEGVIPPFVGMTVILSIHYFFHKKEER